jgi:hypothetical protein
MASIATNDLLLYIYKLSLQIRDSARSLLGPCLFDIRPSAVSHHSGLESKFLLTILRMIGGVKVHFQLGCAPNKLFSSHFQLKMYDENLISKYCNRMGLTRLFETISFMKFFMKKRGKRN